MSTSREFLAHPRYRDAAASRIPAGLPRSQALDLSHGTAGFAKSVSDIQHAYTRCTVKLLSDSVGVTQDNQGVSNLVAIELRNGLRVMYRRCMTVSPSLSGFRATLVLPAQGGRQRFFRVLACERSNDLEVLDIFVCLPFVAFVRETGPFHQEFIVLRGCQARVDYPFRFRLLLAMHRRGGLGCLCLTEVTFLTGFEQGARRRGRRGGLKAWAAGLARKPVFQLSG